jgi:addiction module HigA family antidote
LSTTTERERFVRKLPNVHPGEVLLEEFLTPLGVSQNALARAIEVPPRRVNEIVLHKRGISADTALRFAHYFGTSEQFWMNLQATYDLEEARHRLGKSLARLKRVAMSEALVKGLPAVDHQVVGRYKREGRA